MGLMSSKAKPNTEVEDAADQQSEPQGEPANEAEETGADQTAEPTGEPAGEQQQGTQQGEAVSPEEQHAYTATVLAGLKVLADPNRSQQILQTLQQGGQPDTALANVMVSMMVELDRQAQGKIPEVVIIPAAMNILSELGDLVQKAGVFEVDNQVMTAAAQQLVMKLLEQYGVDPQDVDKVMQQLDQSKVQDMIKQQQGAAQSWAGDQGGQPDQGDQAQADQSPPDQTQGTQAQPAGLMQQGA